jgi:hypothetical protein
VIEALARERKLPNLRELLVRERPTVRLLLGAGLAVLVALAFSVAVLSPGAWPDCLKKISQLSADNHPASIALRSLIGGWEDSQAANIQRRMPLFLAATALYVGLVALAARRRRMDQGALLGMILVPVCCTRPTTISTSFSCYRCSRPSSARAPSRRSRCHFRRRGSGSRCV